MNGVMIPEVSAGSNHVGASEMCTAQLICPSGAASLAAAPRIKVRRMSPVVERPRTVFMEASLLGFQLQVQLFVGKEKFEP
jgi:hypothetical protein